MPAVNIPCPNTLGSPASLACTSSWCIGLKSPDAPAYVTRSVRVSVCENSGASSPSLTSSKNSFCSAIDRLSYRQTDTSVNFRGPSLRVLRESQDALGDDVALDLAGAAGDGQAAGEEELLRPGCGRPVGDGSLPREQLEADLVHVLVVLDAEQLLHGRLGARRVGAGERRHREPEPEHRERVAGGDEPTDLGERLGVVLRAPGPDD